jgi:hypothetical protein
MSLAVLKQRPVQLRLKSNEKLVQIVEQSDDVDGGLLAGKLLKFW